MESLSALLMISVGLFINSLRAFLSFLVKLSILFCLCLCSFTMSSLILCRNVSSIPLSDNLSGLWRTSYLSRRGLWFWFVVEFEFAFHSVHE